LSRIPDFRLDMFFVEHGYEARMFINGDEVEVQCRDFAGSHPVNLSINKIYNTIAALLPDITEPIHAEPKRRKVSLAEEYGYE